jgi:hypothetical protein
VSGQVFQIGEIHGDAHFHAAPAPPDRWPLRVGAVPPLAHRFQERRIADQIGDSGTVVLIGPAGCGKTQLAVQRARRQVDLLVWITAGSRDAVQLGYLAAAREVLGEARGERSIRRFLTWLGETGKRWLVVLDGLAAVEDLRDLWPPAHPSGQTLVTTTAWQDAWPADAGRVLVGDFTLEESLAHLGGEVELAARLGHVPVTLAHAATWLRATGLPSAEYLSRWEARKARAQQHFDYRFDALPDDLPQWLYPSTAAAWLLVLEVIPAGLIRPVLELAARLDGRGVPVAVFESSAVRAHLSALKGRTITTNEVREALNAAHDLGVLTVDNGLVRLDSWARQVTNEEAHEEGATRPTPRGAEEHALANALAEVWPGSDPLREQALFACSRTLRFRHGPSPWRTRSHNYLIHEVTTLKNAGLFVAAETRLAAVYKDVCRELGEDGPVAEHLHGQLLALRALVAADNDEIIRLEQVLAEQEQTLGPGHPKTLATRSELAVARAAGGDVRGRAELEAVLAEQQKSLGKRHQDTLRTRFHLAYVRVHTDLDAAITDCTKLLRDQRRTLGPRHKDVLTTRQLLVHAQMINNDLSDPAGTLRELIEDLKSVFGRDDAIVLSSRANLAVVRARTGDSAGAAAELEDVVAAHSRLLGPANRETLALRRILAAMWFDAGDQVGALAQLEQVKAEAVRVLHPDDEDFARITDLFRTYHQAARRQVRFERERLLGPLDPRMYFMPDDSDAAHMRQLYEVLLRDYGSGDAENVLSLQRNIAFWHGLDGNPDEAVSQLEQVLANCERVLAADHVLTAITRSNLAFWRVRAEA